MPNVLTTDTKDRPIDAAHLDAVRLLASAGLPLDSANAQNETVLASNFGAGTDRRLVIALLDAGAKAADSDLELAIGRADPALLRMLLPHARSQRLPARILQDAAAHLDRTPDLLVALLDYGAEIPTSQGDQLDLLKAAAGGSSEVALGLMLTRGLALAADPENEALEAALTRGRAKNVALLASKGLDVSRTDTLGQTALHRVIIEDARGNMPSRLGAPQQASITALIDGGFPLNIADGEGRTVIDRAGRKPSTLAALNAAIAGAGAASQGIYGAIRASDLNKLRQLAADAAVRESLDSLGRTPLGLALQLRCPSSEHSAQLAA